jgi:hypothetical protein
VAAKVVGQILPELGEPSDPPEQPASGAAATDAENINTPEKTNKTDIKRPIILELFFVFCKIFIFVTILKI